MGPMVDVRVLRPILGQLARHGIALGSGVGRTFADSGNTSNRWSVLVAL